MEKKGQAAMEFLMTYGWAILAAVIVIGVLASFGVFSPGSYVPNKCILNAPLGCNAGTADVANGVQLEIRNGAGEAITVTGVTVTGCTPITAVVPAIPDTLADQELQVYALDCDLSGSVGQKFSGDITISYTKAGSALTLTSTGDIVDGVE